MKRNLLFLLVLVLLSSAFSKVTAQVTITTPNGTDSVCGLNVLLTATAPPTAVRYEWTDLVSGSTIGGTTSMIMVIGSFAAPSMIQVEAFDGPAPGGLSLGTDTITLTFYEAPTIGVPTDLELCDRSPGDTVAEQNDGLADFNLNQNLALLLNGQDGTIFRVSYHTSMMDASDDVGEIPSVRTSAGETIWARVDNNNFGAAGPSDDCFEIVSFDLIVNPNPMATTPPDMESCDGDNDQFAEFTSMAFSDQSDIITGFDPTLTVNYYLTASDADNAPAGLEIDVTSDYTNVDPMTQIIHARVEDIGTGCYNTVIFDLIVLPTPTPNESPLPYALCDNNEDDVEIFDLTSRETEILGGLDPTIYDIVWYQDPMLANDMQAMEPPSDIADEVNYIPGAMPPLPYSAFVYARVINTTQSPTTRCYTVVTLELVVNPIPQPVQPAAYELCDDEDSGSRTDQISIFDLRSRDNEITASTANWQVTYYFSEPEAEAGVAGTELPDMYANVVPASQTVWARVENSSTGCFDTISLTLVVNPNPSPLPQAPVERCDIDFESGDLVADGMGLFDLAQTGDLVMAIENGEGGVMTDFFETEANAIANDPTTIIPSATLYSAATGSIWARVRNTTTLCATILEVELVVNPSPVISDMLPELTECDDDADSEAVFDLTENEAAIYGAQAPADFNLTYHETQASAESLPGSAADAPIAMATVMNYTAPSGTIWVRLENVITGCINVGSFTITVAPIPPYTVPPAQFFACDNFDSGSDIDGITTFDLTEISDIIMASNPDLMVTYYVNLVDIPASPIPTPNAYQGTGADPQTIFIVIESTLAGMCSDQIQIDLRVNALPALISDPLPNAIACDPDNDGFAIFDLDEYAIEIANGQTGITITFFEVEQDALDNTVANQIMNTAAYNNISGMTTLYARAESVENMPDNTLACAKVFPFDLEAHPTPVLPDSSIDLSITECDLDSSGDEMVDLTVNDGAIFAAQLPEPAASFILTYHISQASADDITDTGIADPANHLVTVAPPSITIFYRILYNDGSECLTTGSFEVTVGALPVIDPPTEPLEECDDDDDEIAIFDLTTIIDDLTFSNPLLNVDFYESQAVIDAGGAPIPDADEESYQNVSNPQLLQIIVTTLDGCTTQTELTIRVLPLPTPDSITPADIVECDDDFDGFLTLDLTPTMNEIDASPSVVRRVFESQADADAYDVTTNTPVPVAEDPAPFIYTNSIPNGQTIYVRIDHDPAVVPGNTCYVVVPVDIIINPLPIINPDIIDPYVFCEQEDGNDSEGILNLNIIASEIGLLAPPQQEGDFNITYHEQQSQADNDAFALTSPYTFVERPAPFNGLWIRVENKVSGCYVIVFEEIIIEARPVANTPEDMMECEIIVPDAANGIPVAGVGEFDLTTQNEVINGGPLAGDIEINYFISQADALNNSNEITSPDTFQNTSNPQTIWAVVENTTTTCPSSPPVFFEISVKATPYTDLSDTGGDICVDPVTGAVQEPVTLDATPETIVAGAFYTYTWTLDGALVSINPQVEVTAVGLYEVTVTATYTDLFTGMITTCDYFASTLYTAISSPLFEVQVLEDSFNASGLYTVQVIESTITGFGTADYEFAIDDGPFQTGLTFTNVRPGDHIVYGRRVDGDCPATPVEIGIIDYPRFFTPNSDGFHDTWNILGLGTAPNLNAKIYIFDRYGKLLKQISPVGRGWNGKYNGQPMPSSDYWFSVEYTEPGGENPLARKTFNGHFTLKR